jgi:LL-diaminopimelate aminotransferase
LPKLAKRFETLPEYVLARIPQQKHELLKKGVDVIDLGPGDADLMPPEAVTRRLTEAVQIPAMNRYGFGLGLVAFREAASAWMKKRFGLTFDPMKEIVPLIGSKEGLSHIALAYMEPGKVAIIPEPGYNAYIGGSLLAGGEVYKYALRPRTNFLVELDEIPADVLKRTSVLYLNYPNNPTGAVAPLDYLKRVVKKCRELDILLVYDNPYCDMTFDGYVAPSIFEVEGARDVAIEFFSMSKTFNMTGWRCAWAAARPEIAAPLSKVKSFVDTGQFQAVQAAAVAAFESFDAFVPQNLKVFKERRDAAVDAFRKAGFDCTTPKGTMYLWIPLPEGIASATFAERLMYDEGVIVLPGSGFGTGGEGFFRISFITSPARIAEAAERAGRVLKKLTGGAGRARETAGVA